MENDYLSSILKVNPPEIETLVNQYWHDVWQYALFLTRQEHLAEDIAQETFIRAFRSIDSFRGQCEWKTWLFRIARNIAFNYQKSAFIKRVTLIGLFKDSRKVQSAESDYFAGASMDELWKSVLELPRIYREILILDNHYGLSHAELSELLGISTGTVKSRLHRARAKLAKRMKEVDGHG
ncbi:RNA polymerase subunit sigma [Paenibacillus baekrokdamisoli]|uniref:RNA polymerase sigma factor n=1 Tax=Paenibacillus baekrokdamisoli TaxID=1712516 RepID=A0A3G9IWH5_9BACL|nr:RNA polymerase sigma factor [Paenibacillus baekrokdamisoli]MBB3068316.1 RNA polymerase sigma-70 factor (ECF subfamily) [Paenibacillus baekrokdamisoli]BBH22642.1 RNA polymerase subunit sigma [Paenibacillus baekrokdamisoli]